MNDKELTEVVTGRETIFEGKVLHVEKWAVTCPNGAPSFREVALHRGASAVVPVDEDGNVYLVRQYRVAPGKVLTEIPAGKLDYTGEDRLEAAKRELREETGFTADTWIHLTDLLTTPGFTNELISIYLAEGLKKGETDFDEDEVIDLVKMPMTEAIALVRSGELNDSKTAVGLLLSETYLK